MAHDSLRGQRSATSNVIPFPVRDLGQQPAIPTGKTMIGSQAHGWTLEAMRDYKIGPSTLSLQEQFDKEIQQTYDHYGPDKDGDIARMNIAARYAKYTDDIGNYEIEGVSDYIWDDQYEDEYQQQGW